MLLRCEDGTIGLMEPGGVPAGPGWLRVETLECVAELNEMSLTLLAEQAAARPPPVGAPLARVAELVRHLDSAGRRRAAGCPYLLLDAGFADLRRWHAVAAGQVADGAEGRYAPFFTVAAALEAARLVLTYAWHLARTQPAAARLLLGMPAACASALGGCSLRQVYTLAERHPEWLRPRWPARTAVWQELLAAAAAGEGEALQRARLHGLTLLAAEARNAAADRPVRF
jgi:hypothetical protein